MPHPCCPLEGNARAAYIDFLYEADGRQYPKHPLHGRYTGLAQQRARQLLALDREATLSTLAEHHARATESDLPG